MTDDPRLDESARRGDATRAKKPVDIACPVCGALVGERCSDVEVFVRDSAFPRGEGQ